MKPSRTLLWAVACLLPLATVARAQTILRISGGQPAQAEPAVLPHGQIQSVAPAGAAPSNVIPVQVPPEALPPQEPSAVPPSLIPPAIPPLQEPQAGPPADPLNGVVGLTPIPDMLSSPLGPPVGLTQSRTVLNAQTVTTTQPVTTTVVQTTTVRVVKVMAGVTVISFRTIATPVTTTSTVTTTSRVTTPVTKVSPYDIPSVGGYRISDNESPIPQTRVFLYLDDWQHPFDAVNSRLGGNASTPYAVRSTFGFEEAVFDGRASIGLRLPIDSLRVDSSLPGTQANDSSIGDLFVVTKVLFYRTDAGSAVSGGLAMTLPTGARSFAGVGQGDVGLNHHANLQPYVGYLWRPTEGLFVQGFSSVAAPMNPSDVTVMYNDVGVGYLFARRYGWLTALAPTAELRFTSPLTHRGVLDGQVYGETQVVQFLGGLTMEMNHRSNLTFGVGVPLTGPRPYDWEFMVQYNLRF